MKKNFKWFDFHLAVLVVFFFINNSFGQIDTWMEVNDGFAKCAPIGQSAGYATWDRDNFDVEQMLHKRGEMYAYIKYDNDPSVDVNGVKMSTWNSEGCGEGLFRHDTVRNKWIKVADINTGRYGWFNLVTNGSDIFLLTQGNVFVLNENYSQHSDGWKKINVSTLKKGEIYPGVNSTCVNANDVFSFSIEGSGAGPNAIAAIGDTIYIIMLLENCPNENRIGKFCIPKGTWTFDKVGKLPHQVEGASVNNNHYIGITITSRIGGLFNYFMAYRRWGGNLCTPKYIWVFDPRVKKWINISSGVKWHNRTGNSNPEGCVDPKRTWIDWGGSGGLYPSWDKRGIYATSEMGIWRWAGDKWYWIGDNRENSEIIPTNSGIYTRGRDAGIVRLDKAVYTKVGNLWDKYCVHNGVKLINSPDDGKSLYVVKNEMKDPEICGHSGNQSAIKGIYRIVANPDKPGRVRNLHVETATYVGGPGDNTPVNVGIAGKHQIFIAGNYSNVRGNPGFNYGVRNFNGASPTSRGKLINMNTYGDTVLNVINLGNQVYDYEVQNFAPFWQVVCGDFGVTLLDSSGLNVIWTKAASAIPGTGETRVDIDDQGHVVVLKGPATTDRLALRSGEFTVFDENGNAIAPSTKIVKDYLTDITIKNDTIFVVGFSNGYNRSTGNCGGGGNLPVQSAFIIALKLEGGKYTWSHTTFNFNPNDLDQDMADTRGYRINIGKDGKLYYLGEAAGGNSVYRWNGKITTELNGCKNPPYKLVSHDSYSTPFNTKSAHIAYFCTIDPKTGEVERGQYIIPRQVNGESNSFRVKDGYIHSDEKGYVYISGQAGSNIAGREILHVNGVLVGAYAGGDMSLMIVAPDYKSRTYWGVYTDTLGMGVIQGIGVRDNIIVAAGRAEEGKMITGGKRKDPVAEERIFKREYALNPEPFNLDMDGLGGTKDKNLLNDTYLAVWYQDVWNHANKDTLEEKTIPNPPAVISEKEFNYRANFAASKTTICDGDQIIFSNTSVGDSIGWKWNFGEGATLSPNTEGKGPFAVTYNTPGFKSVRLDVLLKNKVWDYELKADYINVLPKGLTLDKISGPTTVCSGIPVFYSIRPVFGVSSYVWSFPPGTTILKGEFTNVVQVALGPASGEVKVKAKYACGESEEQVLQVDILPSSEKNVLFVVGDKNLTVEDKAMKDKLSAAPYNFNVIEMNDGEVDATHAGCASMVIISSTVNRDSLNYKLRSVPIPVIVYNHQLFDEFGLTNGGSTDKGAFAGQTQVVINSSNTGHELAANLSGTKAVYKSSNNLNWGKPTSAAVNIANASSATAGAFSIFGYERGAAMAGLTAPARRVGFYLVGGPSNLTANGDSLLGRAICWVRNECPNNVTITTSAVTATSFCPGDPITVNYTITGTFKSGNVFTAQLSNNEGIFTFPSTIGSVTGTTAGSITGTIPSNIVPGTKYRIRVIGSNPSEIGQDNGADITIGRGPNNAEEILGDAIICKGSTSNIYTVTPVPGATKYMWDIPLGISVSGPKDQSSITLNFVTATSSEIKVKAVNACGASSSFSRLLVNISDDVVKRAGAIQGKTVVCPGDAELYTISPIQFAKEYEWTLPDGSKKTTTEPTNTIQFAGLSDPVNISVRGIGACGAGQESTLSISKGTSCVGTYITTSALDKSSYCAGATIQVPFILSGPVNNDNIFTAQLSDVDGSFVNPVVIGTLNSTTSGSISAAFPSTIQGGSAYRIRVVSSSPEATGTNNGNGFTIVLNMIDRPVIQGDNVACIGGEISFAISPIENASSYEWTLPDGSKSTGVNGGTAINYLFSQSSPNPSIIKVKSIGQCAESEETSISVSLQDCQDVTITTDSPTSLIYCAGASLKIQFTTTGIFDNTNVFKAQLSNELGSFSDPTEIGQIKGNSSGEIDGIIPDDVISGQKYRIRVISSSPVFIGSMNASGISLSAKVSAPAEILGPIEVCPNRMETYYTPIVADAQNYIWTLPDGSTSNTSLPTLQYEFTQLNGQALSLSVKASNSCGESVPVSLAITPRENCETSAKAAFFGLDVICQNQNIEFFEQSEEAISWEWDFDTDATPQTYIGKNPPSVIYSSYGIKSIKLTINKGTPAISVFEKQISVLESKTYEATLSSATTSICEGEEFALTVNLNYSTDNNEYKWMVDGTIDPLQITNQFTSNNITNGQNIYAIVKVGDECAMVSEVTSNKVSVLVKPGLSVAQPSSINGEINVCPGDTHTYETAPVANAISYQWTIPANVSAIVKGNNSNKVKVYFYGPLGSTDKFSVKAIGECSESSPRELVLANKEFCDDFFVPNVFTPGANGNNLWVIEGLEKFPNVRVTVFNRWGSKVFESKGSYKFWDGMLNGQELPVGTYYYVIETMQGKKPKEGSVTIIR